MTTPSVRPAPAVVRQTGAGRGYRWWAESASWLFGDVSRLGAWIVMLLCFFLILAPLHWFPVIGSIAANLLFFVLCGGLMLAARATERGQVPRFADLFAGFGPRGGALAGAGLLVLLAGVAVLGLMMFIGLGGTVAAIVGAGSVSDFEAPSLAAQGIGGTTILLLLCCLLLFVPISMAAWLAPALIVLRGASPVDALRLSLGACLRNGGALTVYGLVGVALAVVSTMLFLVGWILLLPMAFLSTYAAYLDLFEEQAQILEAGADRPV